MRDFIKKSNAKGKPGTAILTRKPNREWAGDMPKGAIMKNMKHEEPLVKMTKDRNALSVSPVVNTKKFHDAFESMPVPKSVAEGAYRETGRILSACDGTELEHLVAINARTGALVADNLDVAPSRTRATGFRNSDIKKIQKCTDRVVTIHNHPGSRPPSYRDLMTLAENQEISASLVVGHDGSLWYMAVNNPIIAERLERTYNSLKDLFADAAESMAARRLVELENGKSLDWRRLR